jgi:LPXTG-motif cell wall-anchored protein
MTKNSTSEGEGGAVYHADNEMTIDGGRITGDGADTGDGTNLLGWFAMMLFALLGLTGCVMIRRKNRR